MTRDQMEEIFMTVQELTERVSRGEITQLDAHLHGVIISVKIGNLRLRKYNKKPGAVTITINARGREGGLKVEE